MSSKRRKMSHESGAVKEASIQTPKTKSKPQTVPQPSEPSPTPSSEAESETMDNTSGEGNGEAAPKSFQDLVCDTHRLLAGVTTDSVARASSTPSATPATALDTRSQLQSSRSRSRLPCKTAISSELQRPVAVKLQRSLSRC